MGNFHLILILTTLLIAGCNPDPPLLTTPLPNGYSFDSNGGWFGYIKTPDGKRMSEHFGIIENNTEAWCEEFAWQQSTVICKLSETKLRNNKKEDIKGYFIIDTKTSEVTKIYSQEKANEFWVKKLGSPLPEMKTRYRSTKRK